MGQHLAKESYKDKDRRVDFTIDMVFASVFFVYLCIHSFFSWKSLMVQHNWNIYNFISFYCIFICLTIQIVMMLWVSFHDENQDYHKANVQQYLFFQLPFDCINIVVIA